MNISEELTICRQDVVVLSDTEESCIPGAYKKKMKRKVQCVRKVQLTRMTVDRIVPLCLRQRCRRAQYYNIGTSKNTKYNKHSMNPKNTKYNKASPRKKRSHCKAHRCKDEAVPPRKRSHCKAHRCKQEAAPPKKRSHCKNHRCKDDAVPPRKVYSPITIESSSDPYEDISSCSFNTSDSDELEELIKTTRKRMKEDKSLFTYGDTISECSPITSESQGYENILSDEDMIASSIHSVDTVVLDQNTLMPSPPVIPSNDTSIKISKHNIEAILVHHSPIKNNNNIVKNPPSLYRQESKGDSPVYEISGKVFMEHYLNTSIVCAPERKT